MDIAQLVDMLSHMAHQAGQAINDKMNGNDLAVRCYYSAERRENLNKNSRLPTSLKERSVAKRSQQWLRSFAVEDLFCRSPYWFQMWYET